MAENDMGRKHLFRSICKEQQRLQDDADKHYDRLHFEGRVSESYSESGGRRPRAPRAEQELDFS